MSPFHETENHLKRSSVGKPGALEMGFHCRCSNLVCMGMAEDLGAGARGRQIVHAPYSLSRWAPGLHSALNGLRKDDAGNRM